MLRKLKLGRDNWIDALSRSTDKPIMEYCEYKNGAISYNRAFPRPQSWSCNEANNVLIETVTVELAGTLHTGSSSNYKSILENGLWAVNPQDSSSRQRTIDLKGLDDEPRMVLYRESNPPVIVFVFSIYDELKTQIWNFVNVAVTA